MAKLEQGDKLEIFQECNNDFSLKEQCSLEQNKQEKFQDFDDSKQTKNSQHVIHVGIIVVLLTIYLGLSSVPKCLVNCVENASTNEKLSENKKGILSNLQENDKLGNGRILERLLEYKDICRDLEIFTENIKQNQQENMREKEEYATISHDEIDNNDLMDMELSSDGTEEYYSGSGASGQGGCASINRNQNKKSKYSIKTTNNKNDFNKYNKSTKSKFHKNQKKDLNLNKKNSTSEPIIYLFALVFIYLLLKAASDINQHYKSQNKNDKRLRRCSLQSYAQIHRPDRRASKGISTKGLPKF